MRSYPLWALNGAFQLFLVFAGCLVAVSSAINRWAIGVGWCFRDKFVPQATLKI